MGLRAGPALCWTEALGDVDVQYVWRFLRGHKIDLVGRKSWCESNDPNFTAKAADVVGRYVAPPAKAMCYAWTRSPRSGLGASAGLPEVAEWLVRNGLALDWPQYSKGRFGKIQHEAEQAGRGMWAGSYVEPWLYRVCIRAGGRPAECSDDANAHP